MKASERWKPQQPTPVTSMETERPKVTLRDSNTVLTQGSVGGHSKYKIPPGTTRSKTFQETFVKQTDIMETNQETSVTETATMDT